MENKAAFLLATNTPLSVQPAPLTQPEHNEVLICNHAIAVNPVDHKQQDTGTYIQKFPYIMGLDIAGTIIEVGSSVTAFKKGDRVAALAPSLPTGNQAHAGFQLFTTVPERVVSHIPDHVSFTNAAVLPITLATACFGLYEPSFLGIEPPSLSSSAAESNHNKAILVWGGSSGVGSCVIQLCALAGFTIIATASPKNFGYVKDLGATEVFDYNEPDVVKKLVAAADGKEIVGAYDTITSAATMLSCANFLHAFGGGKLFTTLHSSVASPEFPEGVVRVCGRPPLQGEDGKPPIWQHVWVDFMSEGLRSGKFRPKPDAFVLKGGLEKLQEGIDMVRKGVSAQKIVVDVKN